MKCHLFGTILMDEASIQMQRTRGKIVAIRSIRQDRRRETVSPASAFPTQAEVMRMRGEKIESIVMNFLVKLKHAVQ